MKRIYHIITCFLAMLAVSSPAWCKDPVLAPSYAWDMIAPLGLHTPTTIDTLYSNYGQRSVPVDQYTVYATTGNLGGAGINMDFMRQPSMSQFFFRDAVSTGAQRRGTILFTTPGSR